MHPSIVLWCGGNEFDPGRSRPVTAAMERAVGQEDQERSFRAASPTAGDSHNWSVWHEFQPPGSYTDDPALFASEFGLQSPPNVEALQRFLPEEEVWPPGPSWQYHGAGLEKLWRYARPFLDPQDHSLQQFVGACQRAQAHGLQIAIEHYRRSKAKGNSGVLIWQLNEPWPAISWALVDFARQPKPAYLRVQQLMTPLLISLEYPLVQYRTGDTIRGRLWVINDSHQALEGCQMQVTLWDGENQAIETLSNTVDVVADSAQVVGELAWCLPLGGGWRIACSLQKDGEIVTANDYDIGIHDDTLPTARQRLRAWLRHLIIPS